MMVCVMVCDKMCGPHPPRTPLPGSPRIATGVLPEARSSWSPSRVGSRRDATSLVPFEGRETGDAKDDDRLLAFSDTGAHSFPRLLPTGFLHVHQIYSRHFPRLHLFNRKTRVITNFSLIRLSRALSENLDSWIHFDRRHPVEARKVRSCSTLVGRASLETTTTLEGEGRMP